MASGSSNSNSNNGNLRSFVGSSSQSYRSRVLDDAHRVDRVRGQGGRGGLAAVVHDGGRPRRGGRGGNGGPGGGAGVGLDVPVEVAARLPGAAALLVIQAESHGAVLADCDVVGGMGEPALVVGPRAGPPLILPTNLQNTHI